MILHFSTCLFDVSFRLSSCESWRWYSKIFIGRISPQGFFQHILLQKRKNLKTKYKIVINFKCTVESIQNTYICNIHNIN